MNRPLGDLIIFIVLLLIFGNANGGCREMKYIAQSGEKKNAGKLDHTNKSNLLKGIVKSLAIRHPWGAITKLII